MQIPNNGSLLDYDDEHPSHDTEDIWVFQVTAAIIAGLCIVGNGMMVTASTNARRLSRLTAKNCLFLR
jgi:hypothetical protein